MTASFTDRRALLGAGALIAGAGALASTSAEAKGAKDKGYQPTPEAQDAWMDKPGTRHRMVFDTTSAESAEEAMAYSNNFYIANLSGYGIAADAIGMIIVLRHFSTPFAYGDAIWQKYGATFAHLLGFEGEVAEKATKANPKLSDGGTLPNGEAEPTLTSLAAKGARYAVCGMATKFISGVLAKGASKTAAEVEAELVASLIPGAVMVPAGIVAVNRAQEHGYTLA